MMSRKDIQFLSIAALLCFGTAHAEDRWICKFWLDDTPKNTWEGPVSVDGRELLVSAGDPAWGPGRYQIVENTRIGVIAIEPRPNMSIVVMMDRENLVFTYRLTSIGGNYEERMSGKCRPSV